MIRVVSGGQTGVDRAALDAAAQAGVETGGWCPRGRRAEDGRIPDEYPLTETTSRSYSVRTEWNVRDSDGTLILVLDEISSGTQLTIETAQPLARPVWIEHLTPDPAGGLICNGNSLQEKVDSVVGWVRRHRIRTLNVAGPRGSSSPDMYTRAFEFMQQLLARCA